MTNRLDVFLQYYLPHVSGLTNTAADINEYVVERHGYAVHVHCSRKKGEPKYEVIKGVHVHRYASWARIGRASLSPGLAITALRFRRRRGLAHMHLPYPEAGSLTLLLGRNWRTILTYHCDAGRTTNKERAIARLLDASHRGAIRRAETVVVTSEDYAMNSRLVASFRAAHTLEIPVPSRARARGTGKFRVDGKRLVGFLGRPTSEKGLDVLIDALRLLPKSYELLVAGPTSRLVEANAFQKALEDPTVSSRIHHLGLISDEEVADFYASLDVFTLPSTNSFEAFGIVQVEAIAAGVPVVASNLPGVRTITQTTGFGAIVAIGDAADLAVKILEVSRAILDETAAKRVVTERYLNPVPLEMYAQEIIRLAGMTSPAHASRIEATN